MLYQGHFSDALSAASSGRQKQQQQCIWPASRRQLRVLFCSMCGASSPLDMLKIAIVIPTLNEEEHLAATLRSVAHKGFKEVIVVDGGSTDRTVALAKRHKAKVLHSVAGRGPQLNVGWRASKADWMLFLHADTQLPVDCNTLLSQALQQQPEQQHDDLQQLRLQQMLQQQHQVHPWRLQQPAKCWGCFKSIKLTEVPHWQSWLTEQGVALRTQLLRLPYGDQAIFVSKQALQELQGFAEWRLLEDVDLVTRLNKLSAPAILNKSVVTSGRRYKALGFWRTILANQAIMLGWCVGLQQDALHVMYDAAGKGRGR